MKNNLLTLVITLTIGIIFVGSLLAPVIQDYENDVKVVKNNTTTNLAAVVGEDHTIEFTYSTGALEIDGEAITAPAQLGVLVSDQINLIYNNTPNLQLFSSQHTTGIVTITSDTTVTIEGNTITITYGTDTEEEYTCEWIYLYDANGDYGIFRLYNANTTVYLNNINQLHGSNILVTTYDWFSFVGTDVTLAVADEDPVVDIVTGTVTGTNDIFSINIGGTGTGFSFDVDNSGTDYTVKPWIYVVPIEVSGYSDMNKELLPLMSALPILVIVALIAGAAAAIFNGRKD